MVPHILLDASIILILKCMERLFMFQSVYD